MRWPETNYERLLGFAIRRRDSDRSISWLKIVLRFDEDKVTKGRLYDSDVAPIQSLIWTDFGLSDDKTQTGLQAGSRFTYEAFAVCGVEKRHRLITAQSVRISFNTEPEYDSNADQPEVHFNRGLSSMQEYERLFGEGHKPEKDPRALSWLARDLEVWITDFIGEVIADEMLQLDIAAYHLDSPAVLGALLKVAKGPGFRWTGAPKSAKTRQIRTLLSLAQLFWHFHALPPRDADFS